ncbi:MAG: hypothetical protein ABSB23_18715 [Bryobacteraceae bacterium]|jgi:surfactin synthase thioesterase subunit
MMAVGWLTAVTGNTQVDQLAKQAAEIALRLAALPAGGMRNNTDALDSIEELAVQILKEVSAVRAGNSHVVGESSGMWRVRQFVQRH